MDGDATRSPANRAYIMVCDFHARSNEVYAVMEGEVIKVGHDKRSGNYVTIRHGNYTVSYCHLSKALVRKNTVVKPGEVVAITGNTGTRTTGEHLHLSAKYKGKYINPNILLDFIKETKDKAIARYSSHAAHNQDGLLSFGRVLSLTNHFKIRNGQKIGIANMMMVFQLVPSLLFPFFRAQSFSLSLGRWRIDRCNNITPDNDCQANPCTMRYEEQPQYQ